MNPRQIIDMRVPTANAWKRSEHELQVAVVTRALAFDHPDITLLHAIPNGDWRGFRVGAKLKAEGVIAGIPDLCLPVACGGYHGFYLELKRAGNKPTDDQWSILERLHANGYFVRVTNHLETALGLIRDYLKQPLIERIEQERDELLTLARFVSDQMDRLECGCFTEKDNPEDHSDYCPVYIAYHCRYHLSENVKLTP
jgi:hypothetical protein